MNANLIKFKHISKELAKEAKISLPRAVLLVYQTKYGKCLPPLDISEISFILDMSHTRTAKLLKRAIKQIAFLARKTSLKDHTYKDGQNVHISEKLLSTLCDG